MESTQNSQAKSTVIIIYNLEFKSKIINFLNQIFYYFLLNSFRHLTCLKKVLKYKLIIEYLSFNEGKFML